MPIEWHLLKLKNLKKIHKGPQSQGVYRISIEVLPAHRETSIRYLLWPSQPIDFHLQNHLPTDDVLFHDVSNDRRSKSHETFRNSSKGSQLNEKKILIIFEAFSSFRVLKFGDWIFS